MWVSRKVARWLRELRVERGMTQADLARRAKVTTTYVSKLESAEAAPGIDLVEKLALALGVGVTDLIPVVSPEDAFAISREQARQLSDTLLGLVDQQTFALLNPFLALLVESSGKRA